MCDQIINIDNDKEFKNKYINILNEFTSFQILFEPYQLQVEKKLQLLEIQISGNQEIIDELNIKLKKEESEKKQLINQIKDIHSMVLLMKNKLETSEKEIKLLKLKNDELTLDIQLLKEEKEFDKQDLVVETTLEKEE